MTRQAIQPVQLQMLVKPVQTNKPLQGRSFHLRYVFEAKMVCHQRGDLLRIVVRESQPPANLLGHFCPYLHMFVETDARSRRRSRFERRRLAHIVKQHPPCERR
jgi:hypothetical protein